MAANRRSTRASTMKIAPTHAISDRISLLGRCC
jgi:hypothetical protein